MDTSSSLLKDMSPSGSQWNGLEVKICVLLKQTCFMVLGGFHGEEMQIGEEKSSSMECQPSLWLTALCCLLSLPSLKSLVWYGET